MNAVLAGLGLAYLPEDQVQAHLADGRLIRVLADWCAPFPGYHLYYRAAASSRRPLPCWSRALPELAIPPPKLGPSDLLPSAFPEDFTVDGAAFASPCPACRPARHRSRGESDPGMNGKRGSNTPLLFTSCAPEQTFHRELVPDVAITRTGGHCMRRFALIALPACFAGHDRIRFRQAGHGPDGRAGRRRDRGQAWARPRPRTHGTGDAVTITGGTGAAATTNASPSSPLVRLSLDSLSSFPLPGRYANCSDANGSRPRGAAGSASNATQ